MFYTYIIQSQKDKTYYIGFTENLKKRISEHNKGGSYYTSLKSLFKLVWYGSFMNKLTAQKFEKYLKTSSGFAFRNKRLL